VSAKNFSATADVPRVHVKRARMRFVMLGAVFLIPIAAVALALTFRSSDPGPPLLVRTQTGIYQANVGDPLSVTAFRVTNSSKSVVAIKRIRVAPGEGGISVIGALAYRGCPTCVTSSAVPPRVTAPAGGVAPRLLPVASFTLKPGDTLTLILSVRLSRKASVHVPPLRIDTTGPAGSRTIETGSGPGICAAKFC
jgi:hypothetical protein